MNTEFEVILVDGSRWYIVTDEPPEEVEEAGWLNNTRHHVSAFRGGKPCWWIVGDCIIAWRRTDPE